MNYGINIFLLQTINLLNFHVWFNLVNFYLRLDFIHNFAFVYVLVLSFGNWTCLWLRFNSLFFFHLLNPERDLVLNLLLRVYNGLNLIILRISLT